MKNKDKYLFLSLSAMVVVTFLSGCSGSGNGSGNASDTIKPQALYVSAPLSADQQARLAASLQLLDAGNVNDAINSLVALQTEVGFNTDIQYALGRAFATRSGLSLSSLQALATPKTVQAPDGSQGTTSGSMLQALQNAATYQNSFDFQRQLNDGQAALDLMVPEGTSIPSLSMAAQAQVGVVAAVQSLRLVSQVMQGTPRQQLNSTTINTLVQGNYTPDVQHKLESANKVLRQTVDPTRAALSDNSGTAAGTKANVVLGQVLSGFAGLSANGTINGDQLAQFLVSLLP